jgi:hypothetical protein
LVLLAGLSDGAPPKTDPPPLFEGVAPPKIDDEEVPLKFPKIDGLLSYWDAAVGVDGDSTDDFSSLVVEVCFCTNGCDLSVFPNENLRFSLELNGVFDAGAVDGV